MTDGTYNMRFRIYDNASGGSVIWSSTRSVSSGYGVTVTNGQFSILLGELVVLDPTIFSGATPNLFLEVELPTPATATSTSPSWTEGAMTPRNQITTSAYAFNAETLDGLDSSVFAQLGANNIFGGSNTFSGATTFNGSITNGSLFSTDTQNSKVIIGLGSTNDSTAALFVVDSSNNAQEPAGENGSIYFNSNTSKFRCYENGWVDCVGTRQIRSFVDTTGDSVVDADTTNYWDLSSENNSSHPNITPTQNTRSIIGIVSFETASTTTSDRSVVAHIERNIGSPVSCGSGQQVGTILSTFTTNNGEQASNTTTFVDDPSTTGVVYYTLCSDSATSAASGMTINRIRFTLEEASNSNS